MILLRSAEFFAAVLILICLMSVLALDDDGSDESQNTSEDEWSQFSELAWSQAVFDNDTLFEDNSNTTICSDLSSSDFSNGCQFWMQGVLLCIVSFGGIIGNSVSVFVLTRDEMLSVFNQILAVMTFIDTLFLVTSIAEFSFVEAFHLTSTEYDTLFVYFLYPMHNVFLTCSIFLHTVLAFERYLAVCHPQHVYSTARHHKKPTHSRKMVGGHSRKNNSAADKAIRKKVLIYVLPVVLVSLMVNVPRWFELELTEINTNEQNSTNSTLDDGQSDPTFEADEDEDAIIYGIAGTWLRYNKYYVHYYLHWTLLFVTGILPLAILAFLNTRIYNRITEVRKFRTSANSHTSHRNEPNYAATLASIIVIFVVCHLPRVIKNIYEIVVTNQVIASGNSCHGITPAKCLVHFNNLILAINASSGFFIYCFVGTFGTQFVKVLTGCCRPKQNDEEELSGGQTRRRQVNESHSGMAARDENVSVRGGVDHHHNCTTLKTKVELLPQSNLNQTKVETNSQLAKPADETYV